ncbi:MAG: Rieske (2Fe-2S) protein [Acidobacteria bacterium]|nr:Rieske (2Fe-2S) protein [Acidobacteriota bacterium]
MNSKYLNEETVNNILAEDDNVPSKISSAADVREASDSHQQEFPYDRDEESNVTRREFCNFLFLTSGALFMGAAGFAAVSAYNSQFERAYAPMKIDGAAELKPGNSLNFRYPDKDETAILIRTADGNYYAYGQKCTHLTCPVYFAKENNRIECPCHEGGFDVTNGNVLYGPPPRPLDRVDIEVKGDGEVWAIGRKAGGHENA